MNIDTIFLIGPQGSGKGTQARILAQKLGFFYWEMGGILREVAKSGSDIGNQVQTLINQGVLLEDDLLLSVVKERLGTIPEDQGIIFDGIPRRLGQARFLLDFLKQQHRINYVTLFIDLPQEESLNRLLLRAGTEGRKDDTREAIEFRLQQYQKDTIPVLDYLKQHCTFINIDGRPPIEQVTAQIDEALSGIRE